MATTYPSNVDELAQVNGVGMGKVQKFGKPFLDLINKYVEDNEIETTHDLMVKTKVNKSKTKIFIIQQIDRKIGGDGGLARTALLLCHGDRICRHLPPPA